MDFEQETEQVKGKIIQMEKGKHDSVGTSLLPDFQLPLTEMKGLISRAEGREG